MPLYDVSDHPALTAKARDVRTRSEEAFAQHTLLAETLLGLNEPVLTGRAGEQITLAVALQVNWQVMYDTDPFVLASEASGSVQKESLSYKADVPLVDPRAAQIVEALTSTTDPDDPWGNGVRSLRGPCW